jgi:hypothetical protein
VVVQLTTKTQSVTVSNLFCSPNSNHSSFQCIFNHFDSYTNVAVDAKNFLVTSWLADIEISEIKLKYSKLNFVGIEATDTDNASAMTFFIPIFV